MDQAASSLSQITWCKENSINIHNFRYWKSRLNEIEKEEITPQRFVELKTSISSDTAPILLKIGFATLEIHENINLRLLDEVLSILTRHA